MLANDGYMNQEQAPPVLVLRPDWVLKGVYDTLYELPQIPGGEKKWGCCHSNEVVYC